MPSVLSKTQDKLPRGGFLVPILQMCKLSLRLSHLSSVTVSQCHSQDRPPARLNPGLYLLTAVM